MSDWKEVRIGDIAEVFDGPHATPKTVDTGPIFLGIESLQNGRLILTNTRHVTEEDFERWTRRVTPREGDIVFSYETRLGEAAIVPPGLKCCLGRRMGLVRVDRSRVDSRFFLYQYISPQYRNFLATKTVQGATVDRILLREFPDFPIRLPPLKQQRLIVSVLGSLDDKIELNRRMNETLEAMAQAIFRDWFVDFGPTRRKLAGITDPVEIMGGLVQDTTRATELAALFPDALGDNGLPEGWTFGKLDDVAEIVMGASPSGETYNDQGHGVPLVNGPAEYGSFFLKRSKWTTAASKLSNRGDLIICVRGSTTGRHAFSDGVYCLGRGVAAIRALNDCQEFVDASVLGGLDRLLQRTTGSVFPNLSSNAIREFSIVTPAADGRSAYCALVRPLRDLIWANVEQEEVLAATRDLLLPKLMSGEIRLREAEEIAEAAQ